jgi:hypothetical protein
MRRQNLTNLPVTNSDGRLVGLLLRADADQALEAIRSNAEAPARPRERASLFDSADVTALLAAKLSRPSLHGNRGGPKSACVRLRPTSRRTRPPVVRIRRHDQRVAGAGLLPRSSGEARSASKSPRRRRRARCRRESRRRWRVRDVRQASARPAGRPPCRPMRERRREDLRRLEQPAGARPHAGGCARRPTPDARQSTSFIRRCSVASDPSVQAKKMLRSECWG